MDIGIGLPNPIPGTPGRLLVEYARAAEEAGFHAAATIDRIAYPSYESLVSLAAAAAATERIGLFTNVLLGPTRNPVLLAKEAASVDQISGGRLVLGVGVGRRPDDYELAGRSFRDRGRRWDEDLELIHRLWRGEEGPFGPSPAAADRVPMMFGGTSEATIRRVVRWGIGWTLGGAPPQQGESFAERVRTAWRDAGREGSPRTAALMYFGLGEGAAESARSFLGGYYGERGVQMAAAVPTSADALRSRVQEYRERGFDELYLDPVAAQLSQVGLAAEAVLG
jgi:alkanesulfonate monooxygenase SsuD/methylene tetrahydromethanopterin reductase-like flavin-dependent oxidoreductase (luciferase family)